MLLGNEKKMEEGMLYFWGAMGVGKVLVTKLRAGSVVGGWILHIKSFNYVVKASSSGGGGKDGERGGEGECVIV